MTAKQRDKTILFRFSQLALIVALVGAGMAAATESDMYKGYEMPPYEVIAGGETYELRRYESHILAEVTVRGSQGAAVGRGFQVLANYIFGGNATGEKIAMTVPVAQMPNESAAAPGQGWTVSFMMPSNFELASLPDAKSGSIRFKETEAETLFVLRFSGFRSASAMAKRAGQLAAEAQRRGLTLTGAPRYFFYDGPMTPPWARRNEIALPVAAAQS